MTILVSSVRAYGPGWSRTLSLLRLYRYFPTISVFKVSEGNIQPDIYPERAWTRAELGTSVFHQRKTGTALENCISGPAATCLS
jgi:hypothetical protein